MCDRNRCRHLGMVDGKRRTFQVGRSFRICVSDINHNLFVAIGYINPKWDILLSILTGSKSIFFLKCPVKIGQILKTDGRSNL